MTPMCIPFLAASNDPMFLDDGLRQLWYFRVKKKSLHLLKKPISCLSQSSSIFLESFERLIVHIKVTVWFTGLSHLYWLKLLVFIFHQEYVLHFLVCTSQGMITSLNEQKVHTAKQPEEPYTYQRKCIDYARHRTKPISKLENKVCEMGIWSQVGRHTYPTVMVALWYHGKAVRFLCQVPAAHRPFSHNTNCSVGTPRTMWLALHVSISIS